jgi:hypothetical protein
VSRNSFASGINPAKLSDSDTPKPRRKYGNIHTEYNGEIYHSVLEANAAAQLDLYKRLGYVTAWERQVAYTVGPGIRYICDFRVEYATGSPRTIDMKGLETAEFKLKRKLFEHLYGPLDVYKRYGDIPMVGRDAQEEQP